MLQAFVAEPPCAVCGRAATRVELVAPDGLPADWPQWSSQQRDTFDAGRQRHADQQWWLLFSGIEAGNGTGKPVDPAQAERIAAAFAEPYRYAAVATAGFYDDAGFCGHCDAAYCYHHWNVSSTGYGTCPHGHGRSLDPLWWPDDM